MPRLKPESPPTLSEELRLNSRLGSILEGGPAQSEWPRTWIDVFFKDLVQLPSSRLDETLPLPVLDLIWKHESLRSFSSRPLTRAQLSALLRGIAINRAGPRQGFVNSQRTYPSAGARYPVDTYLLVLRCRDIEAGAYLFDPRAFSIGQIARGNLVSDVAKIFGEPWTEGASVIVFFVAQWERTQIKYEDRGCVFACIEAGHMAQNLILIARQLGLCVCPVGGFVEARVEQVLHLVTPEESPIYSLVIGVRND